MTDYTLLSDDDLKTIRKQYREFLATAPLRHSSRRLNLSYDVRRAQDQIREINLVLDGRSLSKRRRGGPLKEFKY